MKISVKKILTIEIIMLAVIISGFFVPYLFEKERYIIFLLIAGILTYFAVGLDFSKHKGSKEMLKNLLIYLMAFFMLTYLSGLFIGFHRTIYSFGLTNLANNIAPTTVSILLCEILRYQFIKKTNNNRAVIILSGIIFTIIDICIAYNYYNLSVQNQLYEFVGLIVMCGLTKNILLTTIAIKYDYTISIAYRLVMDLYEFLIPIIPGFGPYVKSVILIIFPVILTFLVYNGDKIKINTKPENLGKHKIVFATLTVALLIVVLLNSGFFKYQTLVVGSDSMKTYIAKGDVVLISKLNDEEYKTLKKGDILAFNSGSKMIIHRIYKIIKRDDGKYFVTKGDNNNQPDQGVVPKNDIVGKVILRVKKVGLPSIWLNEMFK